MTALPGGRTPAAVLAVGRWIDRYYEGQYRRYGRRYLDVYELTYTLAAQLYILLAVPILALVFDLDRGQIIATFVVTQLASLVGIVAGIVHIRRGAARPLLQWWRAREPKGDAVAAWRSAVELARRGFVIHILYTLVVTGIPIAVFCGLDYDLSLTGTSLLYLTNICGGVWPTVLGLLAGEMWMRPVVRDLGARVPPQERGEEHGVLLNPQLVFALPAVSIGTGCFLVVLLATTRDLQFSDVGTGILLVIGLSFSASLVLTLLISRLVLQPLDDLLDATVRVGAGDLNTRLPVLGADEFGNVNANFNAMVGELQRSREELVSTREEERRRIRRDLHDGLGPTLAAIPVHLEAVRGLMRTDPEGAERLLDELSTESRGAITDIRRLVRDLRPPSLDELGLAGALDDVARRTGQTAGIEVEVRIDELGSLPAAVEVAAFRIGQEALTNVMRHSGASRVALRVARDGALDLEVRDDGRGVAPDARAGIGLASMRERASEVGGTCVVEAAAGGGTCVHARLPISPPDEDPAGAG